MMVVVEAAAYGGERGPIDCLLQELHLQILTLSLLLFWKCLKSILSSVISKTSVGSGSELLSDAV